MEHSFLSCGDSSELLRALSTTMFENPSLEKVLSNILTANNRAMFYLQIQLERPRITLWTFLKLKYTFTIHLG